ncbi:hypothetical protein JHD50_01495 [Sulfurimonas sp. MAG313]|nr:hypothetical protein [Sulfurimonas sp. MAG313]MDF1879983.1 hypothetical protein [Sulfurimonas sp. MAG313]
MLSHHLKGAVSDLEELVKMSEQDIEDIKHANHEPQFQRRKMKEDMISSFETKKAMIDHEISKLMTSSPDTSLDKLLDENENTYLQKLKTSLAALRDVNKKYAKMVLGVSSFYNTLLERLIPTEMHGYQKSTSRSASFLEIRA